MNVGAIKPTVRYGISAMATTPAFISHVFTMNASSRRLSMITYMPVFLTAEANTVSTINNTSNKGDARTLPLVIHISQNMIEKKTKRGVAIVSFAKLIARQGRNGNNAKKAITINRIFQGTLNRVR